MTARAVALALLIAAQVAALSGRAFADDAPNPDMLLAPAEVKALAHKAEAGDKDAAARLYLHFDAARDPQHAMKWLIAAAKLGDCGAVNTVLGVKPPKIADEELKAAKSYAEKWSCKPDDGLKPPPVPAMY
jgi:hypothetical protein